VTHTASGHFRGVCRLEDEANDFRDGEPDVAVPTGVVEHENDDPIASRAGFLSKQAQQRLEERLGYAVRDVPEDFASGGRNERRDIEPFEPMMAVRGRPFADRHPDPPRHRFQADPVLVGRERLDRRAGVARRFPRDDFGHFFLNASCSATVAALGLRGRGFWIDQPIACNASQPRCGTSEARSNSPAIHRATLPLVQTPPSGGGSARRIRSRSSSSGFSTVAAAPVTPTQIAQCRRPKCVVALQKLLDSALGVRGHRATSPTERPFAKSQIVWKCREDVTSSHASYRSSNAATLR